MQNDLVGPSARALRFVQAKTFECFDAKPVDDAEDSTGSDLRQLFGRNRFFVMKSGKQNLQKIFTDLGDRPLEGRFVPSILFMPPISW